MSSACPDPSAHRDTKLQEQASTAALLATSPARQKKLPSDLLDKDNKLSSRSAAMSLKHARPEDLPSYPSTGGVALSQSHGAANMAHTNQKTFEHWKPDPSSAAGKAALLAKDYKMDPLWQPSMSSAGSKAALIAHKDGGKVDLWSPQASATGNSAATQALKNAKPSPNTDYGYTADGRNRALLAATQSVRSARARSGSAPAPPAPSYPDSANSAYNALNAATKANRRPSTNRGDDYQFSSPALEESRIKHLSDKVSRQMFTEHPPVDIEVKEKQHQDALRASAVSMAKGMYDLQQKKKHVEPTSSAGNTAATAAVGRSASVAEPDLRQQAMQYIHLQEAAHKLANERLAKMDPDGAARYREHYGYPLQSPRKKLTIKDRYARRRSNSDAQLRPADSDSDEDDFRSRRIRNQMNQFNKDLESLDDKKRNSDRAALLAAAEKKVQAQMKSMDEKVYAETGKVSQAKMDEWDAIAREKATKDSKKRTENFGKADIGGGKFMEQSEIEAIAAARLKPTLDEISENAEKRRARDEEIRLEQEEKKHTEAKEKEREREVKNLQKMTRDQEKAAAKQVKADLKAVAKAEKEAEKARKAEEKKAAKEDKRRSKDVKHEVGAAAAVSAGAHDSTDKSVEHESPKTSSNSARAADDEPVSPIISRSSVGDAAFRPSIERAIVVTSTSESEDEAKEAVTSKDVTSEPTKGAGTTQPAHVGTDGPIGTAPALEPSAKDKETDTSVQSPKSPHRISRLLDRFKRNKGGKDEQGTISPDLKSSKLSKSQNPGPASTATSRQTSADEPSKSATALPSEPALGPLAAIDAKAIADEHAEAAAATSPSSFVRGTPKDDDDAVSSLGDLSSDAETSPRFEDAEEQGETKTEEEENRSVGLGIKSVLPVVGGRERRLSLDGSAKSPVRETRFQEQL